MSAAYSTANRIFLHDGFRELGIEQDPVNGYRIVIADYDNTLGCVLSSQQMRAVTDWALDALGEEQS